MPNHIYKSAILNILSICAAAQLFGCSDYASDHKVKSGDSCTGDQCIQQTCTESKDCPDGQICRNGACWQPNALIYTLPDKTEVHESPDSTLSFDFSLPSKPSAPVTIHITVSDDTEISASVTEITINPEDWDKPHTVTISGVADNIADGNQISGITITTESEDPDFDDLKDDTIRITTLDDDACEGDNCKPQCEGDNCKPQCEGDNCEPQCEGDNCKPQCEGDNCEPQCEGDNCEPQCEGDNCKPQCEGDNCEPQCEGDNCEPQCEGDNCEPQCEGGSCPILCEEDKVPSDCPQGMVCKKGTCHQQAGLNITLAGSPELHESPESSMSFNVTLPSKPSAPVTIHVTISDDTEISANVTEITINPEDWDKPHTVTVSGVSDDIADGDQISGISLSTTSDDLDYDGITNDTIRITTVDDNKAELLVTSTSAVLSENSGTDTFTFQLASKPQAPVTVVLSSSDPSALTITSPTTITINPEDWNKPISVTVAAVNDDIADGTQNVHINLSATSTDPAYNDISGTTAEYSITDDEQPSIVLASKTDELSPGNYSTTVTARLSNEPTAPVTVTLTTSDPKLANPETVTLTFTPDNWDTEQVVTVSAVDTSGMENSLATATLYGTASSNCNAYNKLQSNTLEFKIYSYSTNEYGYPDVGAEDKECIIVADTLLPGKYKLQVWGSSGGDQVGFNMESGSHAGLGGYAEGILTLTEKTDISIHVGSMGGPGTYDYGEDAKGGGCNGGGGGTQSQASSAKGFGGGGASDIRIGGNSLYHRVIVAGGGGGTDDGTAETADVPGGQNDGSGGYGGGLEGGKGYRAGKLYYNGGTQTSGYSFGNGESVTTKSKTFDAGGGGGGWFGGIAGTEHNSGGSGGSGYVYTATAEIVDGYLLDAKYQLTEAKTVPGNEPFPSISGAENETGHKGDGFVRITLIK